MNAIVYSSSNEYAYLAGISLMSCLEHNPNLSETEIYILENNMSGENKCKIAQIGKEYHVPVHFVDVTTKINQLIQDGMVTGHKSDEGLSYATYGRLFMDKVLPDDVTRVVYIDCDTLIMGSIEPLLQLDLNGKSMALACDLCRLEYRKVIQIPLERKYYSAGVMVIDLATWRERKCGIRIFNRIAEGRGQYPLVDQDLLNVVCYDEIYQLKPQYNFLSQCMLYNYKGLCTVYRIDERNYYSKEEFEVAQNNPVIYHFSGNTLCRPWYKNSRHPLKDIYDAYYFNSPWKNREQVYYKLPIQYKVQELLYRQPSKGIAVIFGKIMQRMFIKITYGI